MFYTIWKQLTFDGGRIIKTEYEVIEHNHELFTHSTKKKVLRSFDKIVKAREYCGRRGINASEIIR